MARNTAYHFINKLNSCYTSWDILELIRDSPLYITMLQDLQAHLHQYNLRKEQLTTEEFYMLVLFYVERFRSRFTHFSYEDL